MFFSKTDYLLIGQNNRGMLVDIKKLTFPQVTRQFGRTEKAIKNSMRKLHDLLLGLESLIVKEKDDVEFSEIFNKEDTSKTG